MRIRIWINTGFAGCDYEEIVDVDDAEWNAMSEEERADYLDEVALEELGNRIDYGAEPLG